MRLPHPYRPTALRCALFLGALAAALPCATADADAAGFGRRFHVWGRFRPGSWVVLQQGIETLGDGGNVVSRHTCETRMTLASSNDTALTLQVQASLEVGGKKLDTAPQEMRQGVHGETPEVAATTELEPEELQIDGRAYRCEVHRSEAEVNGRRLITKSWIAPQTTPFVLRRLTTTTDVATGNLIGETLNEVLSLSQLRIMARSRQVAEVRIVQRHPRGQTTSRAVSCPEIPGGLVSQTSEEFDTQGRLLRRTKMELVDFETK
ncbi:MAG: hypothetical protein K8U03_25215 [Planctomycetia bacterium]|nr:hypothetical protein [Planctomycetia bacterium]